MLYQFNSPQIVFGWDALRVLADLKGRRAAIITDGGVMEQFEVLDRATEFLSQAGLQVRIVGRVAREPFIDDVQPLVVALDAYQPDLVVALGGGSVMDAAKAAWLFYESPKLTWETAFAFAEQPDTYRSRLIAIPSTSGSGSEVSRVAVLIDPATRLKRLIMTPEIVPTMAVVDPALTATMPPGLTAQSGLDALTHAIEAVVATVTTEFSVALALRAIRLIFRNLPAAQQDHRPAREAMHLAATLASLAASNSTAGIVHGMDQVGPLLGVPHGLVCAILLPYTLVFNLDSARQAYAEMGAAIGLSQSSPAEQAREFGRKLVALERKLELPRSFKQAGVDEAAYFNNIETMVEATLISRAAQLSPRQPGAAEAATIFEQAYWGELPSWIT